MSSAQERRDALLMWGCERSAHSDLTATEIVDVGAARPRRGVPPIRKRGLMGSIDSKPPCANCAQRPGTVRWGDTLAMTHGGGVKWCKLCVVNAQIEHAEERASALQGLKAVRDELLAKEAFDVAPR